MKILVLGCGAQGSQIAGMLAGEEDVESLICADINLGLAKRTVSRVESLETGVELKAERANASKTKSIVRVAKDVDIILNLTFPKFNIPVLEACLEVGAHYLDLLSLARSSEEFPGQTIEDQLKLDGKLKDAGLTALPNMGSSPGLINIMTHHIVNQLDNVDKVKLMWVDKVESTQLVMPWSPAVYMSEFFSPLGSVVWDNGFKQVDLLNTAEEYEFPKPVGKVRVYTVGIHPELYMVSHYLPEVTGKPINYVEMKAGVLTGGLDVKDVWIEAIRQTNIKRKDTYIEEADLNDLWGSAFIPPTEFRESYDKGIVKEYYGTVVSEVTGRRSGEQVRHSIHTLFIYSEIIKRIPWATDYLTGLSATIGALMVARGEIQRKGVVHPDWIEDTEGFLKKVKDGGVQVVHIRCAHGPLT